MTGKQIIRERLEQFRELLRETGIDMYLIPTADFHNSEYVSDYFKVREFLSGFDGSNGTLLVSAQEAGLWTDGRYFIQAERQLQGTGIVLYRMGVSGFPTISEYLEEHLQEGDTLGFDGRIVDASFGRMLSAKLKRIGAVINYSEDLAARLWKNRPAFPCGRAWVVHDELAGRSVEEKLADVRENIRESGAQSLLLGRLDDLMWLFNIRGSDIPCNPVAMAYGYLEEERAVLFLQRAAVDDEMRAYLAEHRIQLEEYGSILEFLETLPSGVRVLLDEKQCSYALCQAVEKKGAVVSGSNPTARLKAVKNPVELEHMRRVFLKDSAAVVRFIYWLKQIMKNGTKTISESEAAAYLDGLRRQTEGYLELSFPTISAYGPNAAMMHYEAPPEGSAQLKPEGMLLVDSGGQYLGGTTDVTRTIALGKLTAEEKEYFTAVASGMLQLSDARFLSGCTGNSLDILARQPIWDKNMDYKCGTGHGIGYMLNVHEGPQRISFGCQQNGQEGILEEGMVVTNEPGVYLEGRFGIRTENVMLVRKGEQNADGTFLYFETLTYVPIDTQAIEPSCMSAENLARLNRYHSRVYEKIAPLLNADEAAWLREATAPVF